jgi:hypothetical protein
VPDIWAHVFNWTGAQYCNVHSTQTGLQVVQFPGHFADVSWRFSLKSSEGVLLDCSMHFFMSACSWGYSCRNACNGYLIRDAYIFVIGHSISLDGDQNISPKHIVKVCCCKCAACIFRSFSKNNSGYAKHCSVRKHCILVTRIQFFMFRLKRVGALGKRNEEKHGSAWREMVQSNLISTSNHRSLSSWRVIKLQLFSSPIKIAERISHYFNCIERSRMKLSRDVA